MPKDTSTKRPRVARRVAFSQFSQLVVLPDEEGGLWYSRQDLDQFRQSLLEDITRMSTEMGDPLPSEAHSSEHECDRLGLELILEHGPRFVLEKKLAHSNAILLAQDLQARRGVVDVKILSCVSQRSSGWARARAQELACA